MLQTPRGSHPRPFSAGASTPLLWVLVLRLPPFPGELLMAAASPGWLSNQKTLHGLPWWRSGWGSACQCRGHGFETWSGKIPHATEQLGPWATTTEPAHLEPVLRNKRGHDSERPAQRDEEWPPLATTWESPHTEMKTDRKSTRLNSSH